MPFRNVFIIVFGLIAIMSHSQQYNFDVLTVYKSDDNPSFQQVVYSNSQDNTYFLKLNKRNNQNRAAISDLKRGEIHIFNFLESNGKNNEIYFQFDYIDSDYLYTNGAVFIEDNNYVFDFKVTKIDSLVKTVRIIKYRNIKRKKILEEAEMKVTEYSSNMFPVFRFSCLHPYEYSTKFNFGENGIVKSYKQLDKRNPTTTYLDLIKEVNFQIIVN